MRPTSADCETAKQLAASNKQRSLAIGVFVVMLDIPENFLAKCRYVMC